MADIVVIVIIITLNWSLNFAIGRLCCLIYCMQLFYWVYQNICKIYNKFTL